MSVEPIGRQGRAPPPSRGFAARHLPRCTCEEEEVAHPPPRAGRWIAATRRDGGGAAHLRKRTRWSVSRVLFRPFRDGDDHSSRPAIAGRLSRPTRTLSASDGLADARSARGPYSVLLQAGLAMPSLSPGPRWALTPPFHPSRPRKGGGLLSVALSLGSPRAEVIRRLFTVEPGLSSTDAKSAATAQPSGAR